MYGKWILFRLEMKKYIAMVPVILAETVLVGLILIGIGFCASRAVYEERAVGEIKVGIVTQGEDGLTEMLVRFVESMDSVKDTVSFVRLSETEARKALSDGTLSAAVLVPEGIVESVNSGENIPATILLADDYSQVETEVFAQFAEAGAKLLTVAQAGIYAADALCVEEGYPEKIAWSEDYLNRKYLDYAMGRSGFFKEVEVSVASGVNMADYYRICLLLAFLSFAGLFFGKGMRVRSGDREKILGARGVGSKTRYLAEAAAFGCGFAFLGTIIGMPLFLSSSFAFRADWLWMLPLWFAVGIFLRCLFQITGNHAGGILIGFGILMALMLAAGVFIPTAFLPLWVEKIGNISPYKSWIKILTAILQGNFGGKLAAELLLTVLFFALAGCLAAIARDSGKKWRTLQERGADERRRADKDNWPKAQIFGILLKQHFLKFRVWLILGFLTAFFIGMAGSFGKDTDGKQELRGIEVGICVSDEKGEELLSGLMREEGIFRFRSYEDEEAMLRDIKGGSLECGYFLPEGFYEKLAGGKMKRQATLYRSPASSVHKISGEVVFAEMFRLLSHDILTGYLQEDESGEASGVDERKTRLYELNDEYMGDGSTFHFLYETGEGSAGEKPENLNTVRGLAAVMIFLMSLLGLGNVLEQEKVWLAMPGKTGKRLKAASLHIAIAGSICFGGVCLWLTGNMKESVKELTGLFVYFAALEIFMMILKIFVKSSSVLYGLLPIMVLGSCLFCPVFIRIERYLPEVEWICAVFPISYYLRMF